MASSTWGSDVPVSMPQPLPLDTETRVPMFGFAMTDAGLFHDLSQVDVEEFRRPSYAPNFDPAMPIIYGDPYSR